MNNPQISVIIPLYNKSKSIGNTLQSVLSQTYDCFEIIVVDDGSTDDGAEIVGQFNDSRIRLIQKENGGVCSARNRGIKEAKGEFVALLDADDTLTSNYLEEQVRMISDFPEAAMWGVNFAEVYEGKIIHELPTGLPKGFRGIVENYFSMPNRSSDLFCSSSVVIRKSAFETAGKFDERLKYSEDIDMWYRIIVNFPVAFYDNYLVFYNYDAENRAMNRVRSLKYFLPYYVDKYEKYKSNIDFYHFIERWSAVWIKRYYFNDKAQRQDAKIASQRLDYSVLPKKYNFLFRTPFFVGKLIYFTTENLSMVKNKK